MVIKLKEHQQKVVSYMKKSNIRGIILYHGLGSGKTITSIGITETYSENVISSSIVLGPPERALVVSNFCWC